MLLFSVGKGAGIEGGAYVSGNVFFHIKLRHIGLCVLLEMELTTLPMRSVEDCFESGAETFVCVGFD